jgi:glutamate---cysteine ligase / carboxylate-amine ligase
MSTAIPFRALGVEEEFLLVDTATWRPAPVALHRVSTRTPILHDLDDLRATLVGLRRRVTSEAEQHGAVPVATGTNPFLVDTHPAPGARLTCGCQVQVAVESPEEAVAAVERIRPWLPVLIAIASNSPFWRGADTGYASYRTQVPGRRPAVGVGAAFGSPTVEVRVADVPIEVDDAVLVAALARALVSTAARRWREGRPPAPVRPEVARLATWRASRSGLAAVLVDVAGRRPVPARVMVAKLVAQVRDALEEAGDLVTVQELVADLTGRGTGAARQRDAYRDRRRLEDVARMLADRTVPLALAH